jgi:hypothetical protein
MGAHTEGGASSQSPRPSFPLVSRCAEPKRFSVSNSSRHVASIGRPQRAASRFSTKHALGGAEVPRTPQARGIRPDAAPTGSNTPTCERPDAMRTLDFARSRTRCCNRNGLRPSGPTRAQRVGTRADGRAGRPEPRAARPARRTRSGGRRPVRFRPRPDRVLVAPDPRGTPAASRPNGSNGLRPLTLRARAAYLPGLANETSSRPAKAGGGSCPLSNPPTATWDNPQARAGDGR